GSVVVWLGLSRRWPRDVALGRLAALVVGVGLVAMPYMMLIGKFSNKKSPDVLNPLDNEPRKIWQQQPETRLDAAVPGPLFARWWDPKRDEGKNRVVWAAG